jgi:hypothetical protein
VRADFRVAQIKLRRFDGGLVHSGGSFALKHRAGALIERVPGEEAGLRKLTAAVKAGSCVVERGGIALGLRF